VPAELRVVGSGPAWPSAGQACSGYLLTTDAGSTLIDCGSGVFERLRRVRRPEDVQAVIISHLHFDHWVDLVPFKYYLTYEAGTVARPALYLPPGGEETLRRVIAPIDPSPDFFGGGFSVREYDPRGVLDLSGAEFQFLRTIHPIETYAMHVSTGGASLAYTADTAWHAPLVEFAADADVLLCEAAMGGAHEPGPVHLSGLEAGRLARLAGVKRLLLTHLSTAAIPEAIAAAKEGFDGPVEHAEQGRAIAL
jgi:ribonuclease BN (tRNA processing enzyme)